MLPITCSECYSTSSASSNNDERAAGQASPDLSSNLHVSNLSTYPLPPANEHGNPTIRNGSDGYKSVSAVDVAIGNGCASCSFSIPDDVSSRIPSGAPGSPRKDGRGKNGSPLLRSRETIHACGDHYAVAEGECFQPFVSTSPESFRSNTSTSSCHTHKLHYITTSTPARANTFSTLRRACIRTMSCEQLPRGQTSGPLCFGDASEGYTIAFKFRIPDPHARGGHRYYALIALAGTDTGRAFEASSYVWRVFQRIATSIMKSAENAARRASAVSPSAGPRRQYTPVSSFLTGRATDPDGFPRQGGAANVRAKGLTELLDNEHFFFDLHGAFVVLLQGCGRLFGGMWMEPPVLTRNGQSPVNKATSDESLRDEEDGSGKANETADHLGISSSEIPRWIVAQRPTPVCSSSVVQHRHQISV